MLSNYLCLFFPNVVGSESGFYSQLGYGYFCLLNFRVILDELMSSVKLNIQTMKASLGSQ